MKKNGAHPTPPQVIFVGFAEPCLAKARSLGIHNARIVNCYDKVLGYHGPLVVHVCGDYKKLPHYFAISRYLRDLEFNSEPITRHYPEGAAPSLSK